MRNVCHLNSLSLRHPVTNLFSTIAIALFSLLSFAGQTEEFPEIQKGICGSAKAIHNYLDAGGFFLETTMVSLAPDGAHMVYLPQLTRVKRMKDSGRLRFGIERVEVLHQDSSREHPEGWRCITTVNTIMESERRSLTKYLNSVDDVIK